MNTTTVQIYERMTNKAVALYRQMVNSNHTMRQIESALCHLEKLLVRNGDIGMANVIELLEEEYQLERGFNNKKTNEFSNYCVFVKEYARAVKELEDIDLDDVDMIVDKARSEAWKEFKQKEADCAEKRGITA